MYKKLFIYIMICSLFLSSCSIKKSHYQKYSNSFFDTFDTIVTIVAYSESEDNFKKEFNAAHEMFKEYHKYYDIYNEYPNIINACSLNRLAGISPMVVDIKLFEMLKFFKNLQLNRDVGVNIALGPVLEIWHNYREQFLNAPELSFSPVIEDLENASKHCDINKLILNDEDLSIYFADPLMKIDLGAVAKGYATEKVAEYLLSSTIPSFVISAGGNVRAGNAPLDERKSWQIGIIDPEKAELGGENILDSISISNLSVVSSGDYQRYFIANGKRYHHIIDPKTLMPAQSVKAVSVIIKDSALADYLSTALFILPYEEGLKLISEMNGDAIWVMKDGSIKYTDGYAKISKMIFNK